MPRERDYVLGTHDDEIARLGLQHRVWRPRVAAAWMAAGFTVGQTIADLGCGPGYATLDLSEIVGPDGRVLAFDRSRRFLEVLEGRGLRNVTASEADLDTDALPEAVADGVWIRWVLAFVKQPREVLRKAVRMLKPGGRIVIHEYFHYSTWQLAPRSEVFERFVAKVEESWRGDGGEPNIGLDLPQWLGEEGLRVERLLPHIEAVRPSSYLWQWPEVFVRVGLARLVELGKVGLEEAEAMQADFAERAKGEHALLFTPAVLEVIAERRR